MGNFLEILHPVTAVLQWKILDVLSRYDIKTVLDVGGIGKLGRLSEYKVKDANIKLGFDGQELPFDDNKFDAVVSIATLEHVDDHEKFLQECYRVAKKIAVHWFPMGDYAIEVEKLKRKYLHWHSCNIPTTLVGMNEYNKKLMYECRNFISCGEHLLLCMSLTPSLKAPEVYDYILENYDMPYGAIQVGEK